MHTAERARCESLFAPRPYSFPASRSAVSAAGVEPNHATEGGTMKKIVKVFDGISVIVFVLMVLVVLLQVFARYVLKTSVPWTEEMSRLLFIYVGFTGTAIATRENELIVVDILLSRLPAKLRKVFDIVIELFIFAFYCLIFVGAIKMFNATKNTYYQVMPHVSNAMPYVAVIIGIGAALIGMVVKRVGRILEAMKHA